MSDTESPTQQDHDAEVAPESGAAPPDQRDALRTQLAALLERGQSGANWFFWVAALSIVNSLISLFGGGIYFVVGLGITLVVDTVTAEIASGAEGGGIVLKAASFGFALLVAAVLCGFGFVSRKRIVPVFIAGMLLYALDGLIFVAVQDWFSVAFHAFALYGMWGGLTAYRLVNAIERQALHQAG
jgi:hypothetical protein